MLVYEVGERLFAVDLRNRVSQRALVHVLQHNLNGAVIIVGTDKFNQVAAIVSCEEGLEIIDHLMPFIFVMHIYDLS